MFAVDRTKEEKKRRELTGSIRNCFNFSWSGFPLSREYFYSFYGIVCFIIVAEGSIIAQDFYSKVFLKGETSRAMKKSADLIKKMGEPWIFGIDMSEDARGNVESLLKESGLALKNLVLFGEKNKTKKSFYAIAEAEKR
jgi:hypothetical protein